MNPCPTACTRGTGRYAPAAARIARLLVPLLLLTPALDVAGQQLDWPEGEVYTGTFSIAAVDAETGEIGIAVTSRVPCVGNLVPHVKVGVGAVATQALVRVEYGAELLGRLEAGVPPQDALRQAMAQDEDAALRQIGVIAADGRSAQHTGRTTLPWAGHRAGRDYVAQGNVLVDAGVLNAMVRRFEETAGSGRRLGERLIEALAAGDHAGGDRRRGALQSAALLVSDPRPGRTTRPDAVAVDLEICESVDPVSELERVYNTVTGDLGHRTLQQFHGPDVVQLKVILHALGFFRRGEPDVRMELAAPFYDQEIVSAVNAFRDAHELSGPLDGSPPGLVDQETVELMWRELEQRGLAADVRRRIRDLTRPRY
ncbi:MAG TPA: DUF1028 domain-containing protein [Longimicrobiales bacterium]